MRPTSRVLHGLLRTEPIRAKAEVSKHLEKLTIAPLRAPDRAGGAKAGGNPGSPEARRPPGLYAVNWLRELEQDTGQRLLGVLRYVQSHTLLAGYKKGEPIYDGIAEVWFEDTKAMHALRGTKELEVVEADEAVFIDGSTMRMIVAEGHVIKDGEAPPGGVTSVEFVTRKPGLEVRASAARPGS